MHRIGAILLDPVRRKVEFVFDVAITLPRRIAERERLEARRPCGAQVLPRIVSDAAD
jgi:hypothetical protein